MICKNIQFKKVFFFIKAAFIFIFIIHAVSHVSAQSKRQKDSVAFLKCYIEVLKYKDTDYTKAYKLANDFLKKNKSTSYVLGNITMLVNIAEIEYKMMYKFDKSISHINEMRKLSDSIGFKQGIPWSELVFANMYFLQRDYSKSMKYYKSAQKHAITYNDSIVYINALNGIANVYVIWERYDTAISILYECINFYTGKKNIEKSSLVYIYESISYAYKEKGMIDSAIKYLDKSKEYAKKYYNGLFVMNANVFSIYYKYKKDSLYNPIPQLESYQDTCKQNHYYYLYSYIGYMISEVLEEKGRYKEALEAYKETKEKEDSIFAVDKIRHTTEVESGFIIKEKETENKELARLNEINSLKLKNRKIVIALISFMLIQAIVLLYFLYKKYLTIKEQERKIFEQEKEKIAQALDYKKRELALRTLKMFHVNHLLDDLTSRLNILRSKIRLRGKSGEELRNDIQCMLNEIRLSANNKIWEELKVNFNDSNPDFFKWLHDTYPNLTPNEVKLCVFSMMYLKTKDISSIMLKSDLSVQVARTRLRKKLEINDQGTSLSSFLNAKYYEFSKINNKEIQSY